jgi:hypothetical protein
MNATAQPWRSCVYGILGREIGCSDASDIVLDRKHKSVTPITRLKNSCHKYGSHTGLGSWYSKSGPLESVLFT